MASNQWKLEGFVPAIEHWKDQDDPPDWLLDDVLSWVLNDLATDPYPPQSRPDTELGPPWWFARLPFGRNESSRVVCLYNINTADHVLTGSVVTELSLPIM